MIVSIIETVKHGFTDKVKRELLLARRKFAHHKAMLNNEEKNNLELAARIKEILSPKGMKTKAADACDISKQAVNGWMRTGRVEKRNLHKLAELTGVSYRWLLTGTGDKLPSAAAMAARPPALAAEALEVTMEPGERAFLRQVRNDLQQREVPEHVRQAILTLLQSSPRKQGEREKADD